MNDYQALLDGVAVADDEAPLDLILAQHNLQKLNLASPHNVHHLRACIAHQLGLAEKALLARAPDSVSRRHLEAIAKARSELGLAPTARTYQ